MVITGFLECLVSGSWESPAPGPVLLSACGLARELSLKGLSRPGSGGLGCWGSSQDPCQPLVDTGPEVLWPHLPPGRSLLGVAAWLWPQSVMLGSPLCSGPLPGSAKDSWHFLPELRPIPGALFPPTTGPGPRDPGPTLQEPTSPPGALPPADRGGGVDRQQHGPVLFNVKIKDPFTSWVACLWSSPAGWKQGPRLWVRTHCPGMWVEECSVISWSTCSSRKVAEVELTGFARVFPWGLGWGPAATGTRCPTSAPGVLSGKA